MQLGLERNCAYGKFFEKKAVYVSRDWFPDLANYRRDGYDFDARYDDGLARFDDKELFELIDANAPILSKELRTMGGYAYTARSGQKTEGKKGFDASITRLQELRTNTATAAAGASRPIPRPRSSWAAISPTGSTPARRRSRTRACSRTCTSCSPRREKKS